MSKSIELDIRVKVPNNATIGQALKSITKALNDSGLCRVQVEIVDSSDTTETLKRPPLKTSTHKRKRFRVYEDTDTDGQSKFTVYHDGAYITTHLPSDDKIQELKERDDVEWFYGLDDRIRKPGDGYHDGHTYLIDQWGLHNERDI